MSGMFLARASERRGAAAYYDDPLELGYGELSFAPTVAINAPADPGFLQSGLSLVLADDPPGELLGTVDISSTPTGVPFRRTGLAVEWWFYVPFVGDDDRLVIRQLTGSGNGAILGTCSVPPSAEVQEAGASEHSIELRYRPANSHTGATKRVQVWLDGAMVCESLDARLPDWAQGQELFAGMTGENRATPGVSIRWIRADSASSLAPVELAGSCL
ncbi:MAG: hypothetical protein AB8I08_03080 [Sandaracinaceae bacterium]